MSDHRSATLLWEGEVVGYEPAEGLIDRIDADALHQLTGWDLRPEGLCNGDACVPVRQRGIVEPMPGVLSLSAVSALFDRPIETDADADMVAIGASRQSRRDALVNRRAPDFTLPGLDGRFHSLGDLRGRRTVIATFSSWCGCRYDLPGWQQLSDELSHEGLSVILIAFDQDADVVRPFTDGIDVPVLYDPAHVVSELYAISNVPTVVWIDERGRIARPNTPAFGTDLFTEFHGVPAGPHLDAIRAWVRGAGDDAVNVEPGEVADLSEDEVRARLLFRIGAHLHRVGRDDEAVSRFAEASALAPLDFTVSRAAMPLTGRDPFGDEFLAIYDQWVEAGRPFHGRGPDMGEA
jgi:peroxiredoxin